MKYTHKEIQQNIKKLTDRMETMKMERTELTQNINSTQKQIDSWLNMDQSQNKLF